MKKVKPDDYYNDGIFEMIRYGKDIELKNNMTEEMKKQVKDNLINNYEKIKEDIDSTIDRIKNIVKTKNPKDLLNMAVHMSEMNYINIYSESQVSQEAIIITQTLKYIQSVIISVETENIEEFKEEKYYKVCELVKDLYSLLEIFIISYCVKFNKNEDEMKLIQANFTSKYATGKRYAFQEVTAIKEMLFPYANLFKECFNFEINIFFEGMEKIQYAFTHGLNDNIEKMRSFMECIDLGNVRDGKKDEIRSVIENILGLELHNISKITNWPKEFISELSYEVGECRTFFDNSEYSGWPIFKNPLETRPFLILDGNAYCFSIHDLFDNIYRILLKIMRNKIPDKCEEVNCIQGKNAEKIVGDLFKKIIPNSKVYMSNYYPVGSSKNFVENDLIIIYDNNLLLVEVKSGSYTPDFALENIESNIKSLKDLIEKAYSQNQRTLNYFNSKEICPIYDSNNSNKKVKENIRIKDYNNIIKFCITVDSFNEIEAQAEKIKYCNLKDDTIVISIDDFRVYAEYFSSPTKFFHYIEQRKRAILTENISLNDELDHLGLYIDKNMYTLYANQIKTNNINWYGFREKLDKYFLSLYLGKTNEEKPEVKNPPIIEEIIQLCDKKIIHNSVTMTNYILDICREDKIEFNNMINKVVCENIVLENPKTIFASGEYNLLTFIHKGVNRNIEEEKKHTLAVMKNSEISDILELHLFFDNGGKLENLEFNFFNINDVSFDEEEIMKLVAELKIQRLKRHMDRKIGRNEMCPCGSGKKYKKCCGQ